MRSNSFIKKEIFRTGRNIFTINFILLLITVFLLSGRVDTVYNLLFGPFKSELSKIRYEEDTKWRFLNTKKWFYELRTDKTYDPEFDAETVWINTYFKNIKINVSEKVSAKYVLGEIDTTLVLVKIDPGYEIPIDNSGAIFTGIISKFPGAVSNYPTFAPLLLDATKVPNTSAYWWFGICTPLLLLFIWNIVNSLYRFAFPLSHTRIRELSTFGDSIEIVCKIENEIENKTDLVKIDDVLITQSWLIHSDWFSFKVFSISNIRWVYGKVERESLREIPFISTYAEEVFANPNDITWDSKSVIIWTNFSTDSYEIICSELKHAAQIVDGITHRTRQVMVG